MRRAGLATKVQQPDGKSEAHWRRIGAVWKPQSSGSSITWDVTPVPMSPGHAGILP